MNGQGYAAARSLIRRFRLHQTIPVSLARLLDRFTVRRHDLTDRTLGFTIVRPPDIHIGINASLPHEWQRQTEAHELGHILAGHPNGIYMCKINKWLRDELEREAQELAAYLLVPLPNIEESYRGLTVAELATVLEVPPGLVGLRQTLAIARGEI